MSNTPLSGITVVSLEHAIAAPLCTRQLAELGARVIKIERRETGDFARHYDTRVKGQSSHFIWTNRSKQSMTLDLKHEDAPPLIDKLLNQADVFVQNLAPGAARKMGLSFDQLHSKYPKLIVCNISGYGDEGPFRSKKAYDLLVQAEAGFLSVTGTEKNMVKSGISIADIAAGTQAHAAILAALIQRSSTGEGSRIDISMLEAMVEWMGFPLYYAYDGAEAPNRSGADHASIYPYGAFTTNDDKVIMLGLQNEREWEIFCRDILNQSDLINDTQFDNNASRSNNREILRDIIQNLFSTLSAREIAKKLDTAKIAYANVNTMEDVWEHPQLNSQKRFVETSTPAGIVKSLLPPGNNSSYDSELGPVPELGEHTREILMELGYEEDDIENFYSRKLV